MYILQVYKHIRAFAELIYRKQGLKPVYIAKCKQGL